MKLPRPAACAILALPGRCPPSPPTPIAPLPCLRRRRRAAPRRGYPPCRPARPRLPEGGAGPASAWSWPLSPGRRCSAPSIPRPSRGSSGHRGVDLEAPFDGAPLKSPAAGTVSFVGTVVDRPVITIDHGNGLRSSFEPVASSLRAGSAVAEGDVLGQVQTGHCGPAPPCLHWGVRRGEDYVNPLAFVMDLRPSVLLRP